MNNGNPNKNIAAYPTVNEIVPINVNFFLLSIFDKNKEQQLEKLMKHDKFSPSFRLGDVIDEEINYL